MEIEKKNQILMEIKLRCKLNFDGDRVFMEIELRWRLNFDGDRASMEVNFGENRVLMEIEKKS